MTIELKFDLPFSLRVDGTFPLNALGEIFTVSLSTHREAAPRFPGADVAEGVAIIDDESNILAHTSVVVNYVPASSQALDPEKYSKDVGNISLSIANTLVSALRIAYDEHHLDYLYFSDKLDG